MARRSIVFVFAGRRPDHRRDRVEPAQRGAPPDRRGDSGSERPPSASRPEPPRHCLRLQALAFTLWSPLPALRSRHRGLRGSGSTLMTETVISNAVRSTWAHALSLRARCLRAVGTAAALAASVRRDRPATAASRHDLPQPGLHSARSPARERRPWHYDPAAAEQIKRFEDNAGRQQAELDRVSAQAQRMGCEGRGFFSLFSGQPAAVRANQQSDPQMRANLDRVLADLQRVQGNSADREGQRRGILVALGQNDCGAAIPPVRRPAAARQVLRQSVRRVRTRNSRPSGCPRRSAGGSTFERSACAPATASISRSPTRPCRASLPTTRGSARPCARPPKSLLYSHRNPGQDMSQAVSTSRAHLLRAAQRFRLSQSVQSVVQLQARRDKPGRMLSSSSMTRRSSAAISSSTRSARGNSRSRRSTRRASLSERMPAPIPLRPRQRPPRRLRTVQRPVPPRTPKKSRTTAPKGRCAASARLFIPYADPNLKIEGVALRSLTVFEQRTVGRGQRRTGITEPINDRIAAVAPEIAQRHFYAGRRLPALVFG